MENLEFENFEMEENSESLISDEEKGIAYSLKIVGCLEEKLIKFNDEHQDDRVSIDQLKTVYLNAASNNLSEKGLNEWSMARVNMFLSIKAGRKIAFAEKLESCHLSDASLLIIPQEEDFIQAKKDVEDYGLDFEVNIDNLYLEKENEDEFYWEY